MDNILAGVSKTLCYVDGVLVAGVDEQDHLMYFQMYLIDSLLLDLS